MEATSRRASLNTSAKTQQASLPKQKFFQWAAKWFYDTVPEEHQEKPDAPLLSCLLQSIGFHFHGFEKIEETRNTEKQEPMNEGIKVTIECGTSRMRARLEMDDVKCQCPNSEATKDASYWVVSGKAPTATVENTDKVEETGCNLLPPMPTETRKVLNEIIYCLIGLIGDKSIDDNCQNKSRSSLSLNRFGSARNIAGIVNNESLKNDSMSIVRSHTQPEINVSGTNNVFRRNNWAASACPVAKEATSGGPGLNSKFWGQTVDLECESIDGDHPRPSPPKIASSPVILNQLCSSLGQISLQSEEEAGTVAEHIIRAQRALEKALEIILGKRSPLSRNSPVHEGGTFLKPQEGGLSLPGSAARKKSSSNGSLRVSPSSGASSRPGSSCSMPSRLLSSSATTTRPSLSSSIKTPMTRRSAGPTLLKLSTTPLSSIPTTKRNVQPSSAGASKIPGRRKSFGNATSQTLKLAVPKARTAASGVKRNSTSPTNLPPEQRVIVTAKRRVSPDPKALGNASGTQKSASSVAEENPGAGNGPAVPVLKVAPLKTSLGAKDPPARKSLSNPKFGFCNKKP